MKPKIEDLRIGQSVEVNFTGKIVKLDSWTGFKTITLDTPEGQAIIAEGHLAEMPTPEEVNR